MWYHFFRWCIMENDDKWSVGKRDSLTECILTTVLLLLWLHDKKHCHTLVFTILRQYSTNNSLKFFKKIELFCRKITQLYKNVCFNFLLLHIFVLLKTCGSVRSNCCSCSYIQWLLRNIFFRLTFMRQTIFERMHGDLEYMQFFLTPSVNILPGRRILGSIQGSYMMSYKS